MEMETIREWVNESRGSKDIWDSVKKSHEFAEKNDIPEVIHGLLESGINDFDVDENEDIENLKADYVKTLGILNNVLSYTDDDDTETIPDSLPEAAHDFLVATVKLFESHKRESKVVLAKKKKDDNDFIQKAIKKPGSLREYFGVDEDEKIPMGKAREKYNSLRDKAKDGDLTKSELSLYRKLSLFINVLKPASKKNKEK